MPLIGVVAKLSTLLSMSIKSYTCARDQRWDAGGRVVATGKTGCAP